LTPRAADGKIPMHLFSCIHIETHSLDHFHTFGCPAYMLDSTLQDGFKINKLLPRSQVGTYLGPSPYHALGSHDPVIAYWSCVTPNSTFNLTTCSKLSRTIEAFCPLSGKPKLVLASQHPPLISTMGFLLLLHPVDTTQMSGSLMFSNVLFGNPFVNISANCRFDSTYKTLIFSGLRHALNQ